MRASAEALAILSEEASQHPNARIDAVVYRLKKRATTDALRTEAIANAAAEECARIAEENARADMGDG